MKRSITLILILFFLTFEANIVSVLAVNSQDNLSSNLTEDEIRKELETELKSGEAKLDLTPPQLSKPTIKREPLKGSVQHQETINGQDIMKGQTSVGNEAGKAGSGKLGGSTQQRRLGGNARKGGFRGQLNDFRGSNEIGLGIIGVKFVMVFGRTPIIYEVFPGTPAATVGMRPRDIIIAVDGIPTAGLSKEEVYNMIVGQPDTSVTISFKRKNDFQVRQITRIDLNKIDPMLRRDYLRL